MWRWHYVQKVAVSLPEYSKKTDTLDILDTIKKRVCITCGRDISHQHPKSKYCSAKYVGYEAAHRCRNAASNPHNNRRRKIEQITQRGVLFDIEQYLLNSAWIGKTSKNALLHFVNLCWHYSDGTVKEQSLRLRI